MTGIDESQAAAGRLVIGLGNVHRGDDAAGILAARLVSGARVVETSDPTSLLDTWSDAGDVVVIDAMSSGRAVGSWSVFDPASSRLPAKTFPSSHAFGLSEVVETARALSVLPRRLRVLGIEGCRFAPGDPLSPEVEAAILEVARWLSGEVATCV